MKPTTIRVDVPGHAYDVHVGSGVRAALPEVLSDLGPSDTYLVLDEAVASTVGNLLPDAAGRMHLSGGETVKTRDVLSNLWDGLVSAKLDRRGLVVAVGGGATLDVAGFAAATYLRGIRWVGLPTTLLAMVDASVGGKTAINHVAGKNLIGAFHQPAAVLADLDLLQPLPDREMVSGLAEVVKHALIFAPELVDRLRGQIGAIVADRPRPLLSHLVARSVEGKAEVVAEDEKESGRRKILNFGHTVGHGIERVQHNCRHGEAVALGMRAAIDISETKGHLTPTVAETARTLVAELPTPKVTATADAILEAMKHDKKRVDSEFRFVLLKGLGQPTTDQPVTEQEVRKALKNLR